MTQDHATSAQTMDALQLANERRLALAALRRRLRTGELNLTELLSDPPELIHGSSLAEVLRWVHRNGGRRCGAAAIERIGRQAVADRVNLQLRVGRASHRSRMWVAEHAYTHWRPST